MDWAESSESCLCKRTWVVESLILVECANLAHVLLANIEVVETEVLDLARWVGAFRDNHCASLKTPSQKDLGRRLVVLGGKFLNQGILQKTLVLLCHAEFNIRAWSKAAVSHDLDAILTAHSEQSFLGQEGMHFDLERGWLYL